MNLRAFSANLGKIGERAALDIWTGRIKTEPENKKLKDAFSGVLDEIKVKEIQNKRLSHEDLTPFYQITKTANRLNITPDFDPFTGYQDPTSDNLTALIEETERIFDFNIKSLYQKIDPWLDPKDLEEKADPSIRYFIEFCLVLGRLATEQPNNLFKHIHSDQKLIVDGNMAIQFDGVFFNGDLKNNDIFQTLKRDDPWGVLEVKMPMRAVQISGSNNICKPYRRDIARLQNQLGVVLLETKNQMPLPGFFVFDYLRGSKTSAFFPQRIDSQFVLNWANGLEEKIKTKQIYGATLYPEIETQACHLWAYLFEQYENLKRKESASKKPVEKWDEKQYRQPIMKI